MKHQEYLKVQGQILALARSVRDIPLDEFIEAGEHADTVGPFLDPTLWREGHGNLQKIMDLARALRKFQSEVERISTVSV